MSRQSALVARIAALQAKAEKRKPNINKLSRDDGRDLADNSVTKSNALARAYYRFTLIEKRTMEALISQLHPLRHDNDLQDIELKVTDYAKAFVVSETSAYRELAKAANGLMQKIITLPRDRHNNYEEITLMVRSKYRVTEGRVICTFSPLVVSHLIGLREKFTSYPLAQAIDFKSSYTWRFYELLISWAKPKSETDGLLAGWLTVEVTELRKMLGVPESYKYDSFQRQVLDVAIQELQEKANIAVMIERQKTSRKVTHLKIQFIEETQTKRALDD